MNQLQQITINAATTISVVLLFVEFSLKEKVKNWINEGSAKRLEELRSDLAKGGSDYAIYAQKRHSAIAMLYSEFLEAEHLVGGSIMKPFMGRGLRGVPAEAAGQAMNKAREAYFANALYLTDRLEEKAYEICSLISEIAEETMYPSETPAQTKNGKLRDLRQDLHSFLIEAREELSQGRPTRRFPSSG